MNIQPYSYNLNNFKNSRAEKSAFKPAFGTYFNFSGGFMQKALKKIDINADKTPLDKSIRDKALDLLDIFYSCILKHNSNEDNHLINQNHISISDFDLNLNTGLSKEELSREFSSMLINLQNSFIKESKSG